MHIVGIVHCTAIDWVPLSAHCLPGVLRRLRRLGPPGKKLWGEEEGLNWTVKSQKLVSTALLLPAGSRPFCLPTGCEGAASAAEGGHSSTLMHGESLKLLPFPYIFNPGVLPHNNVKRCSWSLLFLFIALILLTCVSESASRGTHCAVEVLSRLQGSKDLLTKWICWWTRCDVERRKKSMMKHQDFCPKKSKNRTTINCRERDLGKGRLGASLAQSKCRCDCTPPRVTAQGTPSPCPALRGLSLETHRPPAHSME